MSEGAPGGPPVRVTLVADRATAPGAVVVTGVRIRAERDVVLQGGEVTLSRSTAYRYTTGGAFGTTYSSVAREGEDVATASLAGPTLLRAGRETTQQVLLPVPAGAPPTAAGQLVQIDWRVAAVVRFEGTGRAVSEPVGIAVLGRGRGADPDAPVLIPAGRFGSVEFEGLPGRRIGPGAEISGWVVLRPRRPGAVEGVRLELVLREVVPHGPLIGDDLSRNPYIAEKEAERVAAKVDLGLPLDLGGGRLRAPFLLLVPADLPAPTLVTDQFSLRWLLRAVVTRRGRLLRRTTTADLELDAGTAPG